MDQLHLKLGDYLIDLTMGQVLYIGEQYYEVSKVEVVNGGSGYTKPPVVTIDSPSESWGIDASAIAEINSQGEVSSITLVSSGRGFDSIPSITFADPDVGNDVAIGSLEATPKYYLVECHRSKWRYNNSYAN